MIICYMHMFIFIVANVSSVTTQLCSIETSNDLNYNKWKQYLEIVLGIMELQGNQFDAPNEEALLKKRQNMKILWRQTTCVWWICRSTLDTIHEGVPKSDSAKSFLDAIVSNRK